MTKRRGDFWIVGVLVVCAGGCLIPHVRHSPVDGWSVDWDVTIPWLDGDDDPQNDPNSLESLHRDGYGFNNEKNAQKAVERARNR